ncbi:Rv3654c family TadE-like protein [Nocardia niigatensis]|uniref:Rv3654c family TadE-like protein n=1 Tax=Nocardia niigatensis TaxID=209249 RepID=UPI0003126A8E|nr:Rv3654c family TadE-like protein [Nocardia niigatensis]
MKRTTLGRAESETGGVTVTACLALIGLLAVTVLIAQIGVAVTARHQVQAAADLSALAAAGALDGGTPAACGRAAKVAGRMSARIAGCAVLGWDVTVTVAGRVSLGPLGEREVRAAARAGPSEEPR